MPIEELAYEDLIAARERAVETLRKGLTDHEKTFLVSLKAGPPLVIQTRDSSKTQPPDDNTDVEGDRILERAVIR